MKNLLVGTFKFAALLTLGGAALTQAAETESFHLPMTAHWGDTVLPAGDYTMLLPDLATGKNQFQVKHGTKTVFVFPQATDPLFIESNSSYLKLQQIDGEYFICGLHAADAGKEFTFRVPKTAHRVEAVKLPTSTGGTSAEASVN